MTLIEGIVKLLMNLDMFDTFCICTSLHVYLLHYNEIIGSQLRKLSN